MLLSLIMCPSDLRSTAQHWLSSRTLVCLSRSVLSCPCICLHPIYSTTLHCIRALQRDLNYCTSSTALLSLLWTPTLRCHPARSDQIIPFKLHSIRPPSKTSQTGVQTFLCGGMRDLVPSISGIPEKVVSEISDHCRSSFHAHAQRNTW